MLEAAAVPNGEQPKYFMLNLVYATGVIETPSGITGARGEDTRLTLKVRSETQYLQAYLSLTCTLRRRFRLLRRFSLSHRVAAVVLLLFISKLEPRIVQAVLAVLSGRLSFPS